MTDTILESLLAKGKVAVDVLRAKEMDTFANALEVVLDRVELDKTAVEDFGWQRLELLLEFTRDQSDFEAAVIRQMTAQELIDDMNDGAAAVRHETAAIAETNRKVRELLIDLGRIGVSILLAVL